MENRLSLLKVGLLLSCWAAVAMPQQLLKGPSYSQQATAIWENIWIRNEPVGNIRIPSPDGTKNVTATYEQKTDFLLLTIAAGAKQFKAKVEGGVGAELAWSPDSKAFFMTWSDSGLDGEYHTLVFYVSERDLRRVNLDLAAKRAFGHPIPLPCDTNVVGVAWLDGSRRILIAVQVPPLSICDSYNTFRAFEVSLPEAVVIHSYGQIPAKKKFWTYLGKDLRDAPDDCITDPNSCKPANYHP
jgi:hypothetical protein